MIIRFLLCLFVLGQLTLLTGCETAASRPQALSGNAADISQHHGYALLYSTLKDESQLDKALILKNPGKDVEELVKLIATFAGEAKSRLDVFAREDATLNLLDDGLPELETEARGDISSATGKQILLSGGEEFAFNILMTQHEALKYINALARQLADHEVVDGRKRFLEKLADDSKTLHELVLDRLKTPYVAANKR